MNSVERVQKWLQRREVVDCTFFSIRAKVAAEDTACPLAIGGSSLVKPKRTGKIIQSHNRSSRNYESHPQDQCQIVGRATSNEQTKKEENVVKKRVS
jgi:hypothetical protein